MVIKNVIVAGASGTIGAPIVAALLESGNFNVSALSRNESKSTFPSGVTVKRADLTSHDSLVEAIKGQDAVISTLNDAAAEQAAVLVEAAFDAGVKRFLPNEWASHDMTVPGTPMEEFQEGRHAIVSLLNQKVKEAQAAGREFHWTGLNTGVFFDWALQVGFIDITLTPTKWAKVWDSGSNVTSATNLSTVGKAVVAILATAEEQTRDRLVEIESFPISQNSVIEALEKTTGERWAIEKTTAEQQLAEAQASLEKGDFLTAFYTWVRAFIFSGKPGARFQNPKANNELLGLPHEDLQETVEKIVKGENV